MFSFIRVVMVIVSLYSNRNPKTPPMHFKLALIYNFMNLFKTLLNCFHNRIWKLRLWKSVFLVHDHSKWFKKNYLLFPLRWELCYLHQLSINVPLKISLLPVLLHSNTHIRVLVLIRITVDIVVYINILIISLPWFSFCCLTIVFSLYLCPNRVI